MAPRRKGHTQVEVSKARKEEQNMRSTWRALLAIGLAFVLGAVPFAPAVHGAEPKYRDDVGGACEPGFEVVRNASNHPEDHNRNGIVCLWSEKKQEETSKKSEATPSGKAETKKQEAAAPTGKAETKKPEPAATGKAETKKQVAAPTSKTETKKQVAAPTGKTETKKPEPAVASKTEGAKGIRRLAVRDDLKGSCPPGFTLVRDTIARPEDQNRNGVVCLKIN